MKKYNLEFGFWHINVSQLKEKEINRITYILGQSRHVKNISFAGYGECTFKEDDDVTHWHPIVEELPAFNRKHSNIAIYDIHVEGGNGRFDKMFLYYSNNTRMSNWGYVLYNTKTKEQKHKYFVYDNLADIILHINKELNKILRHETGHFDDTPLTGVKKNVYLTRQGMLACNDRYRKDMEDLPIVAVTKEVYRNTKSFIEM